MRSIPLLAALPLVFLSSAALAQTPWKDSPALAADPPAIPPPGSSSAPQPPTSTSGSALMPLTPQAAQPGVPSATLPSAPVPVGAERDTQIDNRFKMLEARLNTDEQIEKEQAESIAWLRRFKLTGFVQPQLLVQVFNAAASPNASGGSLPQGITANDVTTKPDGTTTNGTFFRLRRARLKAEYMPTDYARMVFEIDPTPTGGPSPGIGTIARNVEAVGIVHWSKDFFAEYAIGIFKVPFGREVLESDADRPFIERSWSEQNLVPGEYDTGARAYGSLFNKKLVGQLAVVNGVTQGEKTFAIIPDLNRGKDIVARINYDFGPVDAGVSLYYGQGQNLDSTKLLFKQYPRKAVNLEAGFHHAIFPKVGKTRAMAELTIAQNLDRGQKYAFALPTIPSVISNDVTDQNELGLMLRLEQDVTEWVTLGARYDFYTPNTDVGTNGRDTFSFVGVLHFTKGLQMMVELDHAVDNVHAPTAVAANKQIETLSTVLQARF